MNLHRQDKIRRDDATYLFTRVHAGVHIVIDVKKRFLRFLTFLIFPTFFIFKNVHWKYHLKSLSKQRKQIGSVWLFFFMPMLEFPYRPIYWQALLFTYRIGLHQVTPLGVVFLFMLVNWSVEKHQRFLFNVCKRFFLFLSRFLTFFIFFWNVFLHLCSSAAEYIVRISRTLTIWNMP